ncbi:helix-turn-helix transcriptional regulator [Allosphingosinicella deserti]|nr:response regulator transcription factor [Sphingomonas deserti]
MDRTRTRTSILVIDPRPFTRTCMSAGLAAAPDFDVHAVASLDEATGTAVPDLVLLQYHRSDDEPSSLTNEVSLTARRWPTALILIVAPDGDTDRLIEGLQCGVRGVLTTDSNLQAVISSIRLLVADLVVYPREAVGVIRDALFDTDRQNREEGEEGWTGSDRFHRLTPRQQEVLRLLAMGLPNRDIASTLNISESTVKVHLRAIMAQTGVTNRTQVVAQYMNYKSQP